MLSITEQQHVDNIDLVAKNAVNLHHLFKTHCSEIEQLCMNSKSEINRKIDNIIKSLQERKRALNKKVDGWKSDKLKKINIEISKVIDYAKDAEQAKNETND